MIVDLKTLIQSTRLGQKQAFAARREDFAPAGAQETGFHIYGKLKTRIAFAAADNDAEALRYLKVIHALSGVTVMCAQQIGDVDVLELQGEVVHVFLPSDDGVDGLDRVLHFSRLLTGAVYDQVCPLAEDDLFGFSMAADHGPTVFVANRSPASDSIVSLAPAANAPAKRLFAGVSAGHLAVPNRIVNGSNSGWREIGVKTEDPLVKTAFDAGVPDAQNFAENLAQTAAELARGVGSVKRGSRQLLAESVASVWEGPTVFQGFFFRADMHDFSKRIEAAWNAGQVAVKREVSFFKASMDDATGFFAKCRFHIVQLPWAGDCANALVKSMHESYEDSRQSLPAVFALDWHQKMTDSQRSRQWLIGEAGGGDGNGTGEGCGGAVVISPITIDDRRFVLTGGWSVRSSFDAQETDGTSPGDTVIPNSDYHVLENDIQAAFENSDREFWRASKNALARLPNKAREALKYRSSAPFIIGGVERPKPRPYYDRGYMARRS